MLSSFSFFLSVSLKVSSKTLAEIFAEGYNKRECKTLKLAIDTMFALNEVGMPADIEYVVYISRKIIDLYEKS